MQFLSEVADYGTVPVPGKAPDILGIRSLKSRIVGELRTVPTRSAAISCLFPNYSADLCLSRGRPYYEPREILATFPLLLNLLDHHLRNSFNPKRNTHEDELSSALLEAVENCLLALAYAHKLVAIQYGTARSTKELQRRYQVLMSYAIILAYAQITLQLDSEECLSCLSTIDFSELTRIAEGSSCVAAAVRPFRELDSSFKIENECAFILDSIVGACSPAVVLCPIYGAIRLGVWLQALQLARYGSASRIPVYFIRLGFHDQGGIDYYDRFGRVDPQKLVIDTEADVIVEACRHKPVLILDDNVGSGQTMVAARRFVEQIGGFPFVRCCETAWHIFRRNPEHNLAATVNFPSLRSNFHHRLQAWLIDQLRWGSFEYYTRGAQQMAKGPTLRQMRANFEFAASSERWHSSHIAWMAREIACACFWKEEFASMGPEEFDATRIIAG